MKHPMRLALLVLLFSLAFALPAAADAPTEITYVDSSDEVNPCTGEIHTVTTAVTLFNHYHGDRLIARSERTITTSPTGFVGHGTDSLVLNGQVLKYTLNDMLENEAGDRIRAHSVIVVDLSTDPSTMRVLRGAVTCLGK